MRICLITSRPDHPLLAATTALLTPHHRVETVDPETEGDGAPAAPGPLADVYLLKAHTPRSLALAGSFEERGAPVLNSVAATTLCQDRTAMAGLARRAGLPFAATRTVASLAELADERDLPYPLVVKSRHSRRHDLVTRVDNAARLRGLRSGWAREPVVVQEFTENSGWDHKLWAIDGRVFAALRRSELAEGGQGPTLPLALGDLPSGWQDLVRTVGSVFALDVYGVDVIDAGDGTPLIVDINAFPGIRGQSGAPEALAALALRAGGRPRGRS
ncbi:alpha-L-glutamate ligase, RimK family [Streptomyces sp. L-9-10]|uniref:ATP-grasp domain-containing protein n=1 Tax=Streptomyces sp. L-9-10 TaxID=1478131 RepID=UPI00101DE1B5|nr:alpha-L-glutamate ligase [Streptomyces sp. L-9-10]RYJ29001.1 alpha-L-glutamate ligase, RimK family [Streptomyces sp. L-9-10]